MTSSRQKIFLTAWRQAHEIAKALQRITKNRPRDRYDRLFKRWTTRLNNLTKEWRRNLLEAETQWWRARYPNLSEDINALVNKMKQDRGEDWCDLDELATEINRIYNQRGTTLSWKYLVAKAQRLLPDNALWQVPETKLIRLQCKLMRCHRSGQTTVLPRNRIEQIGALTQIARVLHNGADPATVTPSPGMDQLRDSETRRDVTGRWWDLSPLQLRFHSNGRLDVRCETAELAQKLASALASSPSDKSVDQEDQEQAYATTTV